MKNKKIKNASKVTSSGINFKSKLEALVYKTLLDNGFSPKYEERTFEFVPRLRPTIPFFNRIGKIFGLDMRPVQPITYTPDFTFEYNGILVIIEAKGYENDTYPVKRNLFRRYLESLTTPSLFFEVRTKKETLEAIKVIRMENPQIQQIRKLIPFLLEKDIPIGNKLLEARNWEELQNLVTSAITKVEKSIYKGETKYENFDVSPLYQLQALIPDTYQY